MSDNDFNQSTRYNSDASGIECIDVIENYSLNLGTALKYIWRRDHKGGREDLRKAANYLRRECERIADERDVSTSVSNATYVIRESKDYLLVRALLVIENADNDVARLLDLAKHLEDLAGVS